MNEDIIITKPDKGSGVVTLNKNEYNDNMMTILNDITKFLDLGPAISNDNTAKIETQIQRRLLQLNKKKLISKTEYKAIRPTGSQRPRMYGLPKTHRKDVPLRPILSMTGSAQHELAKWLTCLLQAVLQHLSANCVSDSFTFVEEVRNFTFSPSSSVSSVPLTFPASSETFRLLKPYKSAPTPCTKTTSYRSHLFHVTSSLN